MGAKGVLRSADPLVDTHSHLGQKWRDLVQGYSF